MSSTQPAGPLSVDQVRTLDEAVLRLEAVRDVRMLVRLVEKWAEAGQPSARARLAQARAFLQLRLMDRAWVRLKEVGDKLGDDPEVLALTAEMFIERGWPVRARKAVNSALQHDPALPRLHDLLRRSHQPPVQPPSNARDLERTGDPPELLRLAERFLCTGSFLRARSILERLKRQRGAWSGRVDDLLWGLEGDFTSGVDDPLAVAEAVLTTQPLAEYGDLTDHSEVTAHGDASVQDHEEVAFPSLFRRVDEEGVDASDFTGEVTRISRMAAPAEAAEVVPGEHTDAGAWSEDVPMDTQIQVVMTKDGGGPLHHRPEKDGAYDLKGSLNLREYRSSMGMGDLGTDLGAPDLPTSDSDLADFLEDDRFLEEEDDDLIVLTRREADPSVLPEELAVPRGPIEVVERPLGVEPAVLTGQQPAKPASRGPRAGHRGARLLSVPGRRLPLVVGVAVASGLLLLFLLSQLYGAWASRIAWGDTAEVLAHGSYRELLQEEGRLEALLKAGEEPRGTYLAAYAVLEQVLYGEFTGGAARFQAAQETMVEAAKEGGPGSLIALAAAWRAHLLGDVTAAADMLEKLDGDQAEVSYLRSLVALQKGQLGQAQLDAARAVAEVPSSARYWLGQASACQRAGDAVCVEEALAQATQLAPDLATVRLAIVTHGDGSAESRRDALERFLQQPGAVAPRHQGWAQALIGDLFLQQEDSEAGRRALEQALAADPGSPTLLSRVGAIWLAANRPLLALGAFTACLEIQALDMTCHTGWVQARLELDQVRAAEAGVADLPAVLLSQPRTHLLRAWISALGEEDGAAVQEHLGAFLAAGGDEGGEVLYLQGVGLALAEDPVAAVTRLEAASLRLLSDPDPLLRRLGARALAHAAYVSGPVAGRRLAVEALRYGRLDASVHVLLGRMEAAGGHRKDAERHFQRATQLGPAVAAAHYRLGDFYLEAPVRKERQRTWESWRSYLDLAPSGLRAERAAKHLGYR